MEKRDLPNKYSKLLHFGFWLISNISITNEEKDDALNILCLFANIELQTDFYENFYNEEKNTVKKMRKFVSEKRKMQIVHCNEIGLKGRDHILRDVFIDHIIAIFRMR